MSTSRVVILNPAARGGRAAAWGEKIEAWSPGAWRVLLSRQAGEAGTLAKQALAEGAKTLVVGGVDGTINEVINGIQDAPCKLGVLPVGTMNVFARELGLPCNDIKACWSIIERGESKAIDLFQANDRLFVQMAGAGLDAKTIAATPRRLKRVLGPFSYVWKGLALLRRPLPSLHVTIADGSQFTGRSVLLGNGRFYGGSIPLFSRADHQDGLIDVLVIRRLELSDLLAIARESIRGFAWANHPGVHYLQTSSVTITGPEPADFEVDGEWAGMTPLEIARFPASLEVIC